MYTRTKLMNYSTLDEELPEKLHNRGLARLLANLHLGALQFSDNVVY